jgi:long-chain acyl-CoA synthetase
MQRSLHPLGGRCAGDVPSGAEHWYKLREMAGRHQHIKHIKHINTARRYGGSRLEVLTAAAAEVVQRRIAGGLRARGLCEGDRIAVLLPGSATVLCLMLAALRTGVIPVPLDPRLTARERGLLLADADPALVVHDPALLTALCEGPEADLAAVPLARPMHYTSGTTGRPKGVWSGLLAEDAASALIAEERELWGFEPADRHLVLSPLHHSAPLRFAASTLLAGGTVLLPGAYTLAAAPTGSTSSSARS